MSSVAIKTPPHSTNAERTLIGCLILDGESIYKVINDVAPDDFFDPIYRAIYEAVCELYADGKATDFVTISDKLKNNDSLNSIGGAAFLAETASDTPSPSLIESSADVIKAESQRRQLVSLGKTISLACEDDRPSNEIMDEAEQQFLQLRCSATKHKPTAFADIQDERYEHFTAVHDADDPTVFYGLQTGFVDLDYKLVGLQPGDLMLIAGRPGMGKSTIALQIAKSCAERGKAVTIFSLEMSKEQLATKLIAAAHRVDAVRLARGTLGDDEMSTLGDTMDCIRKLPLHIDDDPDKNLTNLRSKARRQKMEHGLDLLVVDYMQLIGVPHHIARRPNRNEEMVYISAELKALAREIDAPIIALSQLSRAVETRGGDRRPILSDLRDSGAIEQDADQVAMLYRDGYYNEGSETPDITEVIVRKNRMYGDVGTVELRFSRERYCYESVDWKHDTADAA